MSEGNEAPRVLQAAAAGNSQLYRELRFKVKQLAKCCGRQGQTIHNLRAELAEVRELNSKLERGELRRLERVVIEQAEVIERAELAIGRLEEKLHDRRTWARDEQPADA